MFAADEETDEVLDDEETDDAFELGAEEATDDTLELAADDETADDAFELTVDEAADDAFELGAEEAADDGDLELAADDASELVADDVGIEVLSEFEDADGTIDTSDEPKNEEDACSSPESEKSKGIQAEIDGMTNSTVTAVSKTLATRDFPERTALRRVNTMSFICPPCALSDFTHMTTKPTDNRIIHHTLYFVNNK